MSSVSELQKFNPVVFVNTIKNYTTVANTALSKTLSEIPYTHVKTSASERIGYIFCDSLDIPRVYYANKFKRLDQQDIILINGIFFKNLFYEYMSHLNINFNDAQLQTKMAYATTLPMISKTEYENMPRRYRGIFTPFDSMHYVLHSNYNLFFNIIFAKKHNKNELKELLERAHNLISMVYPTTPDKDNTHAKSKEINKTREKVSKQQIDTLQKLCDIFTKIDALTQSYSCNLNTKISSDAIRIYDEYRNELSQSNRYMNAQNKINKAHKEIDGLTELYNRAKESERDGIAFLVTKANNQYKAIRQQIITDAKKQITK